MHKLSARLGSSLLSSLSHASPRTLAANANSTAKNYFTYSKEPSQPVDNVPKFVSSEEAVKCIKSGKVKVICLLLLLLRLPLHPHPAGPSWPVLFARVPLGRGPGASGHDALECLNMQPDVGACANWFSMFVSNSWTEWGPSRFISIYYFALLY